jgi:hypothetical protein
MISQFHEPAFTIVGGIVSTSSKAFLATGEGRQPANCFFLNVAGKWVCYINCTHLLTESAFG